MIITCNRSEDETGIKKCMEEKTVASITSQKCARKDAGASPGSNPHSQSS